VKDTEDGHLDAEEHGRDAYFDVGSLYGLRGFDSTSRSENGDEELKQGCISWIYSRRWRMGNPTVCQNDKKMTSLMAATFRSGLCSARSTLIWM